MVKLQLFFPQLLMHPICICCQASPFLLIFAAFIDDEAAEIWSLCYAAAPLPISCTGAATAAADIAAARWLFVAGLLGCCLISFHRTIVCDELAGIQAHVLTIIGFFLDIRNTQCWSTLSITSPGVTKSTCLIMKTIVHPSDKGYMAFKPHTSQ